MSKERRKREPTHYRKRTKNTSKSKTVSLRSLTKDITGVDADVESAYQEVKRIHNVCTALTGRSKDILEDEKGSVVAAYKAIYDKNLNSNLHIKGILEEVIHNRDKYDSDYNVTELENIIETLGLLKPLYEQSGEKSELQKSYEAERYLLDDRFHKLCDALPNNVLLSLGKLNALQNVHARELFASVLKDEIEKSLSIIEQLAAIFSFNERLYIESLKSKDDFLSYVTNKEIFLNENNIGVDGLANAVKFLVDNIPEEIKAKYGSKN